MDRLRSVLEELEQPLTDAAFAPEQETAIFFADYLIWCMAWAICCKPGPNYGRVFVCSRGERFVADSFRSLVDQYLVDHEDLL